MDVKAVIVYGAIIAAVAALLWPQGMAAKAVRSVGEALRGTLAGDGSAVGGAT